MHLVALILSLSLAWADPVPATGTTGEIPVAVSFAEQLEGAKRLYFQGHREEALDLLADLQVQYLVDPAGMPWERAAEALIFLGEIYYFTGDMARSTKAWRLVLETDPDHPRLSPFAHPPEIAGEFEILRATVREEIASRPVPPPPRMPAWTALPLGIPQFAQRKPARGVLYASLQVGFGVGSLAVASQLRSKNVSTQPHPDGWTEEEQARRINVQRYGIQWPLTAGAYVVWIASHVDARGTFRRQNGVDATLTWAPTPQTPATLGVVGRF